MTTLYALEQRVRALEARLADVEGGYGQTIYKLHRHAIRTDLALGRMLDHMGIAAPDRPGSRRGPGRGVICAGM